MTDNMENQVKNRAGLLPAAFDEPVKTNFLFAFPLLKQRMRLLQRLVNDGEFLTLVVGEHASGKSMLLRYFLFHNRGRCRACRIRLRPTVYPHNPSLLKHLENLSAFLLNNKRQYVINAEIITNISRRGRTFYIRPFTGSISSSQNMIYWQGSWQVPSI